MKLINQIAIIIVICWASFVLEKLIPFTFPAAVISILLLLLLLLTGILKLKHVENVASFFSQNMAFFFLPAGVGIIQYFDLLKQNWFKILAICIIVSVITFVVTAYTAMMIMHLMKKQEDKDR